MLHKRRRVEQLLVGKQPVMKWPEFSLSLGALSAFAGLHSAWMEADQWIVTEDIADLPCADVVALDSGKRFPQIACTEWALEVRELDQRYLRVCGTLHWRAVDLHIEVHWWRLDL